MKLYTRKMMLGMLCLALTGPGTWGFADEISGKWNFVLQTDGGERRRTPTFRLDGEKVSGSWETASVAGTYQAGKLELDFPFSSPEGGLSGRLKIQGTLENGSLKGSWEFEGYRGTFTASRSE